MINENVFGYRVDKKNKLWFRRNLIALMSALMHTIICFLLWDLGFFRVSLSGFIALFSCFWMVHLSFVVLVMSGINEKFTDPNMTFIEILWAVTCVLITIYLTDQMRPVLIMFILLALAFGAFQLRFFQVVALIAYIDVMYFFILLMLTKFRPYEIVLKEEVVVVLALVLICFSFAVVTLEMGAIRKYLHRKNVLLEDALFDVKKASMTDELTGIKNRRYILGVLEQQHWLVERQKDYSFSVFMLDIDFFKNINDRYGHDVGDIVLKKTCRVIEKELRRIDFLGRMGGEEFLIIIPFSDVKKNLIMAERIRKNVAQNNLGNMLDEQNITVSIGVATYQWPESIETLLKRADKALYVAKHSGRNRIIIV